jgi:hypothetical protein
VARRPVPLRLPEELVARVDAARGDVSRTRWIERALEAALGGSAGTPNTGDPDEGTPASPRASYRCPAGHDFTSEAAGARCFCNRKVVPV